MLSALSNIEARLISILSQPIKRCFVVVLLVVIVLFVIVVLLIVVVVVVFFVAVHIRFRSIYLNI